MARAPKPAEIRDDLAHRVCQWKALQPRLSVRFRKHSCTDRIPHRLVRLEILDIHRRSALSEQGGADCPEAPPGGVDVFAESTLGGSSSS